MADCSELVKRRQSSSSEITYHHAIVSPRLALPPHKPLRCESPIAQASARSTIVRTIVSVVPVTWVCCVSTRLCARTHTCTYARARQQRPFAPHHFALDGIHSLKNMSSASNVQTLARHGSSRCDQCSDMDLGEAIPDAYMTAYRPFDADKVKFGWSNRLACRFEAHSL
jgi:hypothetical protein